MKILRNFGSRVIKELKFLRVREFENKEIKESQNLTL